MRTVKYVAVDTSFSGRDWYSIDAIMSNGTRRLVVHNNYLSFDKDFRDKLLEELNKALGDVSE